MMDIMEIDGSKGEGGGQILRTSLSLSACTGKAVRICNIRSGRKKPGLMRQHLVCVKALSEVCNAKVRGVSIGSQSIEFTPNQINAGEYHFAISGAGSSCLVFQTVLPALLLTKKTSRLIFEGGTHNPMAPNTDFLCDAFLPMLAKMGLSYSMSIEQYGFYPVGGGRWSITLTPPEKYNKLKVETRGDLVKIKARCIGAGLPEHVMEREKSKLLEQTGWPEESVSRENVKALGSGNVVIISAEYKNTSEVVDSIGVVGIRAERVATKALDKLRLYQRNSHVSIGKYLADQLLLPLAVTSGGCFVTGKLTQHTQTNIEVIQQLSDVKIKLESIKSKNCQRIIVGN